MGADAFDVFEGVAEVGEPGVGVALDEAYAPGQGVAAAAGDAGGDEGVEDLAFGLAEAGHDRYGDCGVEGTGAAAFDAPGDLAAEAAFGFAGYGDAVVAGAFAEFGDSAVEGGVAFVGGDVVGEFRFGDAADDGDFLAVDGHVDEGGEESFGEAAGEPASYGFLLRCNHVIQVTPMLADGKEVRPQRNSAAGGGCGRRGGDGEFGAGRDGWQRAGVAEGCCRGTIDGYGYGYGYGAMAMTAAWLW